MTTETEKIERIENFLIAHASDEELRPLLYKFDLREFYFAAASHLEKRLDLVRAECYRRRAEEIVYVA